jgi:hypothetical protein
VDFFERVGSTVYHHDFHYDSLHPFWTDEIERHSVQSRHFPFDATLRLRHFEVLDTVTIVNPDHTETPFAEHRGFVDVTVQWSAGFHTGFTHIEGLTAPTLLPPSIVPGGIEDVPQQPYSGEMVIGHALGSFRATAFDSHGHIIRQFQAMNVHSTFAELGFEHVGPPGP